MTLDDFQFQGETRYHCDETSIDDAEQQLGMTMPTGYREFITRFGEGTLAGYIRVYPPHQLLTGDNSVSQWRKRIAEHWFWEDSEDLLDQQTAMECMIVADTLDGDEIVAHPSNPNRLYVLPRYEEEAQVISENGLLAGIEWLLTSGALTEPIVESQFVPFDGQRKEP